jgi:hypothetical protein
MAKYKIKVLGHNIRFVYPSLGYICMAFPKKSRPCRQTDGLVVQNLRLIKKIV